MVRVIGTGEYAISNDINDEIKTYALSSCVALTAYNPVNRVLGMVHIVLPNSAILQDRVIASPAYYADTAVPLLINKICLGYGCNKNELEIRIFGGAESMRKDTGIQIGRRNLEMVDSVLVRMDLRACYTDTGGSFSRNIVADVATGTVKVTCQPLLF